MAASSELLRTKCEVGLLTQNPVHECEVKWTIHNVTKFSRRVCSSDFAIESRCNPRFKLVAKFHQKYANVTNLNVGLQRTDDSHDITEVDFDVSLVNSSGDVYSRKGSSYTCSSGSSPHYYFSEQFATSTTGLTVPKTLAEDDLLGLRIKGLVASYGSDNRIFLLPDDVLHIKGVVKTYGCCLVTEELPSPPIQDELTRRALVTQLLDDVKNVHENDLFTDVELRVGAGTIRAHRFVLCLRSPVLRKMFEHDTQEKKDGIIDIIDVEQSVLEAFVSYLYTGIVKRESFDFTCGLYAIADKYEVFSLHQACADFLRSLIRGNTVCRILELADMHSDARLKKEAIAYITGYFHEIKPTTEWESIISRNPRLGSEVLEEVSSRFRLMETKHCLKPRLFT